MARIIFTSHLGGVAPQGEPQFAGSTVGEVLAACFAAHPGLAHYILDDQGHLRKHVHVFIGERRLDAGSAQTAPVNDADEIYVLQALSGGQNHAGASPP